ncbi:MAG: HEAT repeat domain-containing protein [Nitrospira sp.]|nr:HEAT repeat domain-containing protein [Nitrospira sp.]
METTADLHQPPLNTMSKETIETLVSELTHEEDWRRMRATAACVAGGPRSVQALMDALRTGSTELKKEAAAMLARIKDPRAGVALVELLELDEDGVRKAAATALEQMAGVLDVDTAGALVSLLPHTAEGPTRQVLTHLIGAIPTAVLPLCDLLKHPNAEAQIAAALMLDQLLDPRSIDAFIDAMGQPAVQEIAVGTLKKLSAIRERIDMTFNALRDVEGASEREEARMATVIDLLGIGRPSVEILLEYLEDEDWLVREAAADLLGKIGDVRAVIPLMKRLEQDKDTGVKELAIKALGLIGDSRPTQLYLDAIPIRPLRVYAMEALAKIKDVGVLRPYKDTFDQLRTDRDGLVSYNAGLIADKLEAIMAMESQTREEDHEHD